MTEESETLNKNEVIDELEKQFYFLRMENLEVTLENRKLVDEQWVDIGKIKHANSTFKYKNLS